MENAKPWDETILGIINSSVTNAMRKSLRIPLTGGIQALSSIPLTAEGRTDAGPGYFGACLKLAPGATPAAVSGQ